MTKGAVEKQEHSRKANGGGGGHSGPNTEESDATRPETPRHTPDLYPLEAKASTRPGQRRDGR